MYDFATYFAWFVLTLLFLVVVVAIVALGSLPKQIAMKRNHPQVDAINAASWVGLALGGIGWPIAFVWAFINYNDSGIIQSESNSPAPNDQTANLQQMSSELKELQAQMAELKTQLASTKSKAKK